VLKESKGVPSQALSAGGAEMSGTLIFLKSEESFFNTFEDRLRLHGNNNLSISYCTQW
jgi:hypothetical protein